MRFLSFILLASLSVCGTAGAQSNHSQLFFDASGTDQAAYGANQIITISGNVTYYGRRDPRPEGGPEVVQNIAQDFVQPASDIYIVRHGYYHGNQGANFHLFLDDVSGGSPNTVLGGGGGGFFEQQIASTAPQGLLLSGEYDLVVDEHQNGYFEPNFDLYLGGKGYPPAITVSLPVGVPAIPNPAIDAMKAAGNVEFKSAVRLNAAFRVIESAYDKIAADGVKTTVKDVFKAIKDEFKKPPDDDAPFKLGFTAARNAMANKMKHGMGLVSDPPDPNFAEFVVIAPALRADETDPDPLFAAAGAFANALDRESLLEAALLSSLEKYQGAAAALNGRWALAHARGVAHFAGLLAGEIERNQPVWVAMKTSTTASPVDFDALLTGDRNLQARLAISGFSDVEKQYLADLGLTGAQVAQGLEKFLALPRTASKAEWISALDAKIAAAGSSPAGMRQLATGMGAVITALLAETTLDRDDPVIAIGGPFTGTAGTPIAFFASATDFHGRGLIFEWDLDSDGEFDDATGATPSAAVPVAWTGFAALRVTNDGGRVAVAYAPLTVTSANQLPVWSASMPVEAAAEIEVGATKNFSISASDPEGGEISLRWTLDGTEVATGGSFAFTPTVAQRGLHELAVIAADPSGAARIRVWTLSVTKTTPLADLELTMEAPETPLQTGAEFTWTMTVENHGSSAASNVVLTQALPAGVVFVRSSASFGTSGGGENQVTANFGTVAAGGLATLWVQTSAGAAGSYQSSATVSSGAADLEITNNTSSARVRVNAPSPQSADVSLSATVVPSPAAVGGTQTITFTTSNTGPDAASGLVLETQLPESVEFVSATPAALSSEDGLVRLALPDVSNGANTVATVTVRPSQAGSGPASAQVFAAQGDPALSNNQTQTMLSAVFVAPPTSDLVVTQTPPVSPRFGLPATWTITVTNHGPDAAQLVSLNDVLPAGATFSGATPAPDSLGNGRAGFMLGTLASGASRSVSVTVEPQTAGEAVNRVTASSQSRDANGAESVSMVTVLTAPTTSADLSATLGASPATVVLNGQTTLTLTLANTGPDTATAVRAQTRLPEGLTFVSATGGATPSAGVITATVPTLASGAQAVFTIDATAQAARTFVVISEVHSDDLDPLAANNRATATVTVQNAPPQPVDLAVTQEVRSTVTLGAALNVTLTVTNRGPGAATGVTITNTLPAGLTFISGVSPHGTVTHNAGVVTASLGTLAVNESTKVELTLAAEAVGSALLVSTVSAVETESVPGDNSASFAVAVLPVGPVKLMATYRFDGTLAPCEPGAPPLEAIDPASANAFLTEDVNGHTRRVYRWNGSPNPASAQAGLKLNTAGLLPRDNYSVEILFRFTENNLSYRSILHTGNRVGDQSLYVHPSNTIMVYPLGTGPAPFVTGTFHHVTLTVSPDGTVTTWLDGRLQRTEATSILNISEADLLHFFVDNDQGPAQSEYVNGEIALLRVYEGVLPPNRIAAQAAYPFGPDEPMDANADLTAAVNPIGVWTGGYSTTRGTPFIQSAVVMEVDTRWFFWGATSNGPWVYRNRQNQTVSSQTIRQPADLLGMDPSLDGRNAVLRWTAPAGGTYRIQGRWQGIDVSPNGTDVALLKNGSTETSLFEDYVLGFEQRKPFDVTVSVAMGETVEFSVGRGGNSNLYDSTGLDAVITLLLLTDDCAEGTDLAVTHPPATKIAAPGETITLNLSVTNTGLRPAPGVILTDIIPSGLTFVSATAENGTVEQSGNVITVVLGTLAPGETRAVSVLLNGAAAGVFTNQLRVSAGTFDPALENNEASAAITFGGVAPLIATVRTPLTSVMAGEEVSMELVMANGGTFAAPGCTLTASVPRGAEFVSATGGGTLVNGTVVFPARSLAADETAGYSLRLRASDPGTLTLTARASSANPSVRESSGSASIAVHALTVLPDLHVAVSTSPAQLYAGCRFTATYTVTNLSPTPAENVTLRGFLPATVVVISTNASQGTATVTDGQLNASLGRVRQGTAVTVTVAAHATAAEATGLSASVSGLHPLASVPAAVPASLVHLWDFNEPAGAASSATVLKDLVGGAHGTVRGSGALSTGTGVRLPGVNPSSAPYIDLPNGLISPRQQVTFEGWFTVNALGTSWGHVFSFGSSQPGGANGEVFGPGNTNGGGEEGLDFISLTSSLGTNDQSQRLGVRNGDPGGAGESAHDSNSPTVIGQLIHFAVTVDNTTPGQMTVRYYRDGAFKGELLNLPFNLSDLNDVNNWLGRGNWTLHQHVPATYDEFRLYDRVLTPAEIEASRLAGPDALTVAADGYIDPAISTPSTASAFLRRDVSIPPSGTPCAIPLALDIFAAPEELSYRLEWSATPGRAYLLQSSEDLLRWINVPTLFPAALSRESWIDPGPPATPSAPILNPARFYRVFEIGN